jgi:alpha-galactosidase
MNPARFLAAKLLLCLIIPFLCASPAVFAQSNPAELAAKARWVGHHLVATDRLVFSFTYDGVPSSQLLSGWKAAPVDVSRTADGRTHRTFKWNDPRSGLEVRLVAVEYGDYAAVEWTAFLANRGTAPTPIIGDLQGIDLCLETSVPQTTLRTTRGDNYSASSYEPLAFPLAAAPRVFAPVKGRPTNGAWPYFNLDDGESGVMVAVGWPGQWQARFASEPGGVRVIAGQETTRLRLQPGEEIRTPLVALLFWRRPDWIEGQNLWRQWLIDHNLPRPGGKLPPAATGIAVGDFPTTAAGVIAAVKLYRDNGVRVDYDWMDAGWYRIDEVANWIDAPGIGSWVPDPQRFPRGVREVSDYVHAQGMKFIMWFEPERVCIDSDLRNNHPDWILPWEPDNAEYAHIRLLDLGNPKARRWLSDYISEFIRRDRIDVYRQDHNANPLGAWRTADAPDRKGLTENLNVQGYLEFWDRLLRDHPNLMIDSCASGGRRNDLETVRRSVPLLRSDYQGPQLPEVGPKGAMTTDVFNGNQGHTYGLALWLPYYGTGEMSDDGYAFRSHLCPFNVVGTNGAHPDWAGLRRRIAEHEAVADIAFRGNYYPLTPYDGSPTCWMAWEFYSPGSGQGYIQAFRRENNIYPETRLVLRGLNPTAQYEVTDRDTGRIHLATGQNLMSTGFLAYAAAPRTALLFTFRQVTPAEQAMTPRTPAK